MGHPAHHVFELPIGFGPVPQLAQSARQWGALERVAAERAIDEM